MNTMTVVVLCILAGIVWLIVSAFRGVFGGHGSMSPNGKMICPHCGTRGSPATLTKGSTAVELIAWLLLIVPGIIYSLWRVSSRVPVCPSCRQPGMIQVNTPRGQQLTQQVAPK